MLRALQYLLYDINMKILLISAHPSSKGFTHEIAKTYKKSAEEAGHKVELLDLYEQENSQSFLFFENIQDPQKDAKRSLMQEKIRQSDELVFVHPLWWIGMPAVMKNFIDTNFSVGFAYHYVKFPVIKGRPVGLLKGKTARVFVTCDGANWVYKFVLTPHKLIMKYFILQFCGIKCKSYTVFDRMRWSDEERRKKYLRKVAKHAK